MLGKVLAARFVDSGTNDVGVRVISSRGVSSGIDGALHAVKLIAGEDVAKLAVDNMDYAWRKTEGVVFRLDTIGCGVRRRLGLLDSLIDSFWETI